MNPSIRKLIEEKRENEINTVIKSSYNDGMVDFVEFLRRLVDAEMITAQVAYDAAPNADELRMKLKGIEVGSGGLTG